MKKTLNIAVLIKRTTFHKGFGGFETQNKMLVEGLVTKGHNVTVFSPKQDFAKTTSKENGVNYEFIDSVYRMGSPFDLPIELISKILRIKSKGKEDWKEKSYTAVLENHTREPFDIILCQSAIGLGIINNKKDFNIPIISISHGSILGEYKSSLTDVSLKQFLSPSYAIRFVKNTAFVLVNYFTRQREFIHGSTRVVTVSNAVKKQLINETFASDSKFYVIHNGVVPHISREMLEKHKRSNTYLKLLFVGRVIHSKGVFLLLDALNELSQKHSEIQFELDIVGTGPDLEKLKSYSSLLHLEEVNFKGHVAPNEVNDFMLASDIFVMPTIRVEGFPMVIVEAMLAGLPCVVSDIGGNSDAIEDNVTGLLIEPNNQTSLVEALVTLCTDDRLRRNLGENARIKAEECFTADRMIQSYEDLFHLEIGKFNS